MPNICVITILLAAISWATLPSSVRCTYCAFLDRNRPHEAYETIPKPGADTAGLETVMYQAGKGQIQADNVTIRCQDQNHYCYSLWGVDANTTQNVMIMQGCWDHADADECEKDSCVSNRSDTKFCCCHGDLCNLNVTDAYVPPLYDVIRTRILPPVDYVKDEAYRIRAIVIALTSVFACALAIAVTFLVYRLCLARAKDVGDLGAGGERAPSPGVSPPPSYHSQELQVDECIVRGRYGQIWRSSLDGETVAVKILSPQQEKHFLNERDIYNLPFMDHSSLLAFYGSETRLVDNAKQHWLVLEYLPYGSLSSYLKNNVIDWSTLCKMCYSTASGLAHLHTDIAKGDLMKPVIAHRDVTSHNVIVREDMTCCLADFGFALQLKGTRMDVRETEPSLTDVGTLRYMSPEALDGAVNLRDCESSLKQIDVYALGLVVWEIATRCSDLYQGLRVPDYQLPFSIELGQSPTIEDMQLFVSRHKLRPAFPDVWKDSNQAIRLLKETIEECWDQDAEARLTAMCVQERCLDMAALWQVKYRNVLPLSHQGLSDRALVQRNLCTSPGTSTPPSSDKNANLTATSPASQPYTPGYSNTIPLVHNRDYSTLASLGQLGQLRGQLGEYQRLRRPPSYSTSTDERSTDTVITLLSPSVSDHYLRNQGRNTVVERNTHKRSDEDMTYDGNAIIDSARPAQNAGKVTSIFLDSQPQPIAVGETEALVENDDLRQPPEIPHLQNQIPYHQNQIGPGQSRQTTTSSMPAKRHNQPSRFSLRHIKTALNSLFPKKKASSNVTNLGLMASSPAAEHPDKCNLNNPRATSLLMDEVSPLETSVSLVNGATVVAPLMTSSQSSDMTSSVPGSEDSSGGSEAAVDRRLASLGRPSSLSLDSCNSNSHSRELKAGDRIKYRVKTPAFHPSSTKRQGRFSLYDDRMMDNVDNASRDNHVIHEKRKTSISLQQFDMVVNDQLNNNVA